MGACFFDLLTRRGCRLINPLFRALHPASAIREGLMHRILVLRTNPDIIPLL
ncbi:hypothetical protein EI94DRAFT_1726734, partial [Lactarius quietus]